MLWLMREQMEPGLLATNCHYLLFSGEEPVWSGSVVGYVNHKFGWWIAGKGGHEIARISPRYWHSATSKDLHLKPGGGPMLLDVNPYLETTAQLPK